MTVECFPKSTFKNNIKLSLMLHVSCYNSDVFHNIMQNASIFVHTMYVDVHALKKTTTIDGLKKLKIKLYISEGLNFIQ